MSQNPSSHKPIQPLSIGNVVNIGLQLYRSHLKLYFQLSLIAHLWLLVPIYGWAKFYAISGLISCLAFGELIGQSESIKAAKSYINRRLWDFLFTNILVLFTCLIGALILSLSFLMIAFILSLALTFFIGSPPLTRTKFGNNSLFFYNWQNIILLPTVLAIYLSPLWVYSSLFITDLLLSIENKIDLFKTLKRSWELTSYFRKFRMFIIIIVAFLITLPVLIFAWFICKIFLVFISSISYNFVRYLIVNQSVILPMVLTVLMLVIAGVITMPFWQAIKAGVYYDIRCRREGFDLKLRDRKASRENSNI